MKKAFLILFFLEPLQASCILRNVINYSDRAAVILRNFRPVKGATRVPGGARVAPRPINETDPSIVTFNQPTGNQMNIRVVEESELGTICKEYSLDIEDETGKMNFARRESCIRGFGYDLLMPTVGLPDRCYIDLELRGDVNGLKLNVLHKDEVRVILQEEEEKERKALLKQKQKKQEKTQDADEVSPT